MFIVSFDTGADSQLEIDLFAAMVRTITGGRDAARVTVQDGGAGMSGQRAHVTANIFHLAGMQRLIMDKTWLGAWEVMRDTWRFSRRFLDSWYADAELRKTRIVSLETELDSMMNANDGIAGYRLTRGGVSLAACWYVRPVVDAGEDSDQRLYFDHEPAADEYDSSAYGQPARWRPNLQSGYVAELGENMQAWIDFRSLYPWTSVNTDSYQSGEASAVDALEDLVEELSEKETLASAQDEEIAALMLRTFDFFPPTINQSSRTVYHAAAVAARHVVENFYFYPGIKPRWREDLAAAFLTAWKARVDEIVNPPAKRRKTAGGSSTRVARKTDGLSMLLDSWDALTVAYSEYYRTFSLSLP